MLCETNVDAHPYPIRMVAREADLIANAILDTLSYADLFDYALTADEVHRYLIGVRASREEIDRVLDDHSRLNGNVCRVNGFLTLPERESSVSSRLLWSVQARRLWRRARFYSSIIAYLPFVRMVAISGGLAMDNARDFDMDLLIVTAPGRLWLVRGLVVALVRVARLRGDKLCPNFLLTENALLIPSRDLYNAHEIAQMAPLYGFEIYRKMRTLNAWAKEFLPNAFEANEIESKPLNRAGAWVKEMFERMLNGKPGDRIEAWEMSRKIRKLSAQIPPDADAVHFSADVCRGFFSGHGRRILREYYSQTNRPSHSVYKSSAIHEGTR